jgi:hypothetical protein
MGLMAVAALVASSAGVGTAGAHPQPDPAALTAASSGTPPPLLLEQQPAWVGPGQSFNLRLRTDTSVPTSQLGLSVSVYACLSSVSGFDQSVTSTTPSSGEVSSTQSPLPITPLVTPDGYIDLSMPVSVGTGAATTTPGQFTIDLPPSGSECGAYPSGGVFPIRVQLVNTASGQVVGAFTTHLVYANAASNTEKLQVAMVLPVHTTIGAAIAPTSRQLRGRPSAALALPSPAAVAEVTGTVNTIAKGPRVPITLEASPQTIAALAGSAATKSAIGQLASLASPPFADQFGATPYTPVNASQLVAAGLAGELSSQVVEGTGILSTLVTHTASVQGTRGPGDLGPWITNDGLDTAALTQLQTDGYSQVVLPAGSVSSPPSNGSTAEPFEVVTGRGTSMTAVASSADLAARFNGAPGNPVLAAHQLVAELAQIYYEKPNDITPRATVVVAPTSWADNPVFVDTLLGALTDNPIIQPVTVSQLFSTIPAVTSCHSGCRLTGAAGVGGLPVAAIRHQRQQIAGFASAATGATARALATQMSNVVLSGESETLRPAQQSAVLRNAGLAVAAQLGQLTVSGDRTVTLTSQQGTLQVTIVSTAPYPVTASLTLTSDKLLFPNGTTQYSQEATLLPAVSGTAHTNVVPVAVRARTSGIFNVDVVIRSPLHQLELGSGQMSVRSTATSVVGIVLSAGALAVLIVWWVRTSLRRRRNRVSDGTAGPAEAG